MLASKSITFKAQVEDSVGGICFHTEEAQIMRLNDSNCLEERYEGLVYVMQGWPTASLLKYTVIQRSLPKMCWVDRQKMGQHDGLEACSHKVFL